jgi:hypothetical protein
MPTPKKTKIYILGAGCSASNGYPVANDVVEDLESFGKNLNEKAKRIKQCVEETVALMRQENVTTIDDLTARIFSGCFDRNSQGSRRDREGRNRRIDKAKIAIAAMLLSKEKAAKQTGLRNYHDLILEIMPEAPNWGDRIKRSEWHVLTFNYDRLFEIAFSDRLEPDFRLSAGLYSQAILNSGLNPFISDVQFADDRFSFLKLHGTIGARVEPDGTEVSYNPFDADGFDVDQIKDDRFFNAQNAIQSGPLLVFPFEKQHIQTGGSHFYYKKYITAVWNKAKNLIAQASEIRIVGYSFQAIDRGSIIGLLANAINCKRGLIQNLPGEAESICMMLKAKYPEIPVAWEAYPEKF